MLAKNTANNTNARHRGPVARKLMAGITAGAIGLGTVGAADASASSRQWYGYKLSKSETSTLADLPTRQAIGFLVSRGGLGGAVASALVIHHQQNARWSRWQGKCTAVLWSGSAATVSC